MAQPSGRKKHSGSTTSNTGGKSRSKSRGSNTSVKGVQRRTSKQTDGKVVESEVSKPSKDWKFTQWFKKMPSQGTLPDADVLSAIEFDQTGAYLATGDRGGRIVVLEFDGSKKLGSADDEAETTPPPKAKSKRGQPKPTPKIHYKFHCEFQSHEQEFDYVKSLNIEERINKIRWLKPTNDARYMLSTNDKIVKLWKIYEKEMKLVTNLNADQPATAKKASQLCVPTLQTSESYVISEPRRYFANVHEFAINSLSVNTDGESFLTADNLRINMWNLEVYDTSFNLVDVKPEDPLQQLLEVVTCAEFHPTDCSTFLYSTNFGTIRLCDMRDKALCGSSGKTFGPSKIAFRNQEEKIMKEVIQTITDCKFSPNGRHIVSRDYLTVKLWDVAMEREPIQTIHVHDYLRPKLTELYHKELIFDNFGVSINNQNSIVSGGYNNYFHIYDIAAKTDTFVEASKNPLSVVPLLDEQSLTNPDKYPPPTTPVPLKKKTSSKGGFGGLLGRKKSKGGKGGKSSQDSRGSGVHPEINPNELQYDDKILHAVWHPTENAVAVAGSNNLFIYSQQN